MPENRSFKVWCHGYPYRTVRWHYHPEYEIHLIVATSGRAFVGDHVGQFEPGNLVLTGPNLPHNWISEVQPGTEIPLRCVVVQFSEAFILQLFASFPDLRCLSSLLQEASCGVEFDNATGHQVRPAMLELLHAEGPRRVSLFLELLDTLRQCPGRRRLASLGYVPDPKLYSDHALNHALEHIAENLTGELRESELAAITCLSRTAFSRAFKRHTGLNFIRYVNEMRIKRSCELLLASDERVVEICFQVGFNNLSNFNRHFLALKGCAPSAWRDRHRRGLLEAHAFVPALGRSVPIRTTA